MCGTRDTVEVARYASGVGTSHQLEPPKRESHNHKDKQQKHLNMYICTTFIAQGGRRSGWTPLIEIAPPRCCPAAAAAQRERAQQHAAPRPRSLWQEPHHHHHLEPRPHQPQNQR